MIRENQEPIDPRVRHLQILRLEEPQPNDHQANQDRLRHLELINQQHNETVVQGLLGLNI